MDADAPVSADGAQGDIPVQVETDSKDPSQLVQLHQKVKPITWALSLVKNKGYDRTPFGYATGFCVSSEGYIMTCARTFVGLNLEDIDIRARRLDVDNFVIAEIVHVRKEWDIAMLRVEGHDCESGVLVANNPFYCGQPLLCIGHLLHSVGSFRLGRVAFNIGELVREPKEEDKGMRCETYCYESWDHIPDYRTLGDIWNNQVFRELAESQKNTKHETKKESFEFEKQLQPFVPVIHCNGFLQNGWKGLKTHYGCWGAPIFNLRGEIAGMLISKVSNFEIGIHVAALRIFKDDALKKVGPTGLSGSAKSADIEGGPTMEASARKKARTE